MCLLISKPRGKSVPASNLIQAAKSNADGWGVAWVSKRGKLLVQRGMDVNALVSMVAMVKHAPAIIHLRFATHGTKGIENCHPFYVTDDVVMAHNGILDAPMTGDDVADDTFSDTRLFVEFGLRPMLQAHPELFDNAGFRYTMDTLCGDWNKLAFLRRDGVMWIANEQAGHRVDGVWYSNYTYEAAKAVSVWVSPVYVPTQTGGVVVYGGNEVKYSADDAGLWRQWEGKSQVYPNLDVDDDDEDSLFTDPYSYNDYRRW